MVKIKPKHEFELEFPEFAYIWAKFRIDDREFRFKYRVEVDESGMLKKERVREKEVQVYE